MKAKPDMPASIDEKQLAKVVKNKIKPFAQTINNMVLSVVDDVTKDLDLTVKAVEKDLLKREEMEIRLIEKYMLEIPMRLYSVSYAQEYTGIRNDVSKAVRQDVFNRARTEATGTINDKDAAAELASQFETVSQIVYDRAYKLIKAKMEYALELQTALKKVSSRRIAETNLTKVAE